MPYLRRVTAVALALLSISIADRCRAESFGDFRALWISRFDYSPSSASNINTIMSNAASMGFTDILFQVRGRADAFYNGSIYEPKASAAGSNDPLQVAINAAHANGMKLHAWVNTLPLWNLDTAPNQAGVLQNPSLHPYNNVLNPTPANPGYRVFDSSGNVEPNSGWSNYSMFNPVLQATHDHINNVVNDIATRYSVDGIHLDYIRYAPGSSFSRLPHDDISHQMFFDATGLNGASSSNATAYRSFVMNRITDLVASIKDTVDAAELTTGRDIALSAAVWRDPDIGKNDYLQDYRTWLQNDYLDIAMPMIYLSSSNDHLMAPNLQNTLNIQTNATVAPGLGVYLHTESGGGVDLTITQLQRLYDMGADGATFYHYPSFFSGSLAAARRTAVTQWYANLEDPQEPMPTILADFEVNEEPFGWSPTFSGSNQNISNQSTIDRTTAEAFEGLASQQINVVPEGPGSWLLRHVSGTGPTGNAASPAGNVPFAATGYVGFWLKTTDPGVSVQIALDDPGTADRGVAKSLVADNQWRLYEWNLDDDEQWEAWVTGDGIITGPTVTLDSLQFFGSGDATIYLDLVMHNPTGSLSELFGVPGDYNGDGVIDTGDYTAWREAFGQSVAPGSGADGNGDGIVDAADYTVWRAVYGLSGAASVDGTVPVPEPATSVLAVCLLLIGCCRGRRRDLSDGRQILGVISLRKIEH